MVIAAVDRRVEAEPSVAKLLYREIAERAFIVEARRIKAELAPRPICLMDMDGDVTAIIMTALKELELDIIIRIAEEGAVVTEFERAIGLKVDAHQLL